jgi:tetratricopeptide (TPR) repeat protein
MGGDLVYIETLHDLSNTIKLARQEIDGVRSLERQSSIRTGLILSDLPEEENGDDVDPNRGVRDYLESWQSLVEALFTHTKFLEYAPSLEACISKLSDIDPAEMRKLRDLVNLMKQTLKNHSRHECTELRFATLLEVVLSYNADWIPSSRLNELWEELELQVEADCEPAEFRRGAYTVLVSLQWVPSSNGLYSACSYDESESIDAELPLHLASKFDQIYDKPLLRSDKVNQILEQISDEESFTIVISYTPDDGSSNDSNGDGIGKTTLAALLASHPTIAQNHAIFWVDLNTEERSNSLSYRHYMECLENLCQQLEVPPNWPDRILRLEDQSLRIKREREHMVLGKQGVTKLFQESEQNILIVLDGAFAEKDFEWFRFLETQSSIVISKSNYIQGANYTVEMEGLGVDEAVQLFASESSNDPDHVILQTVEAKKIMQQCLCHPLIIRSAAHWFKLKQVTSGLSKGLEELSLELSMLRHNTAKVDASKVLSEVLNLMLSPTDRQGGNPSRIMKLCLASVAVVFSDDYVPLEAVLALWSELLVTNPEVVVEIGEDVDPQELSKRVWFISEAFIHLGLFSFSEEEGVILVKLHHQLYVNYGLSLISESQTPESTLEETKARWHNCFVVGYNTRLKQIRASADELEDKCRSYALKKIITHMIEAKSIPKVLEMLKDERFCRERLKNLGWMKGTRLHVDDCLMLQSRAKESKSATSAETRKVVLSCLKKLASILSEDTPDLDDEMRIEKAMSLHLVGFTLADHNGISEALTQYKNVMQLIPAPGHPFNATIMYSQAVLHLARNDHDKGLKKLKGCLKVLKDNAGHEKSSLPLLQAEVIQLRGDALAAACDYIGAETCYEEALDHMNDGSRIETGTGLLRRARLHQIMGELDQALSALTECINWKLDIGEKCTRNLATAYSLTGDIHMELHEDKQALKPFQRALDIIEELGEEADEVDRHLLSGKIMFLRGDDEGSNQSFDLARDLIRKSPRLLMDESAYDLRWMGKIGMERDEKKIAAEIFEEGLVLTKDRPESLERACVLFDLGHCLFSLKENKEAIACFEEALKIRSSKLGDCELVLDTQITIGIIYRKLMMYHECLGVSKEVMYLTEKLYRGDEAKAASAIFGVAEAYEVLKEYEKAVAMFEECKELLKRALCNDHADVANVLQRLAKLHADHKDFDKSFKCYSEALNICQANHESDHPQIGETLYGIGIVARKRNDYENARDYLQDSLTIYKKQEMARETCLTLIELGNVYRLMKDSDTAIMCYERCLTFLDPEESDGSIFGTLYLAFGHARLSKSQLEEALECYDSGMFASPPSVCETCRSCLANFLFCSLEK